MHAFAIAIPIPISAAIATPITGTTAALMPITVAVLPAAIVPAAIPVAVVEAARLAKIVLVVATNVPAIVAAVATVGGTTCPKPEEENDARTYIHLRPISDGSRTTARIPPTIKGRYCPIAAMLKLPPESKEATWLAPAAVVSMPVAGL